MTHKEGYLVTVGDRGRLVLPAALRRHLGLESGDRLILTFDGEGGFQAASARERARRLQGFYRDRHPDQSPVEDLIAERSEEARKEERGH